ncbi:MAG: sulfite exporter TauE/SafE family protein [Alphaproteobacteria bacterium]|nr:sulfite exporter TauE/SafE family protein [Alphaproteobacteria bacterium]
MLWTPEILALVAVAFVVAGFSKGLVGLGLPTVSLTILTLVIGIKEAVPLMIIPATLMNIYQGAIGGRFLPIVKRLWPLMAASVITIVFVGAELAAAADRRLLTGVFGLIMASYALASLIAFQLPHPGRYERIATPVVGGVGGVITGLTGSFVVPAVFYIQSLGLKRDELVQAMGIMFTVTTLAVGAGWTKLGLIEDDRMWWISAAALVPTMIGMVIGTTVRKRVEEAAFRKVFFAAILIVGSALALRNLL